MSQDKIVPVVTELTPVTNTDLRILIGSLEAFTRSQRSITQHQYLSALRELLNSRLEAEKQEREAQERRTRFFNKMCVCGHAMGNHSIMSGCMQCPNGCSGQLVQTEGEGT